MMAVGDFSICLIPNRLIDCYDIIKIHTNDESIDSVMLKMQVSLIFT